MTKASFPSSRLPLSPRAGKHLAKKKRTPAAIIKANPSSKPSQTKLALLAYKTMKK
tara:strand:- start:735 stop:902 length:168 start_codon:yes stop_codon:yes gene_type:complete